MKIKKGSLVVATIAAGVLAAAVGLFGWWNTNVLGAEDFCGGRVAAAEARQALATRGRVSEVSLREAEGSTYFECTIRRRSKFLGSKDLEVTIKTASEQGDFQFQTNVWKDSSRMSYFPDGAAGAVSDDRGWVLLPPGCWDVMGSSSEKVRTLEFTAKGGAVSRSPMAGILSNAARQVAAVAGCSSKALTEPTKLTEPSEIGKSDPGNACGIDGFAIPAQAFFRGKAESGSERHSGNDRTWACDLYFDGSSGSGISFGVSSGADVVKGVLRSGGDDFEKLPGSPARIDELDGLVLKCASGDVYFGVKMNRAYSRLLFDEGTSVYTEINQRLTQAFVDAAGKQHGCPSVSIPRVD